MADDPYSILGVAREASQADIRRAYHRLALLHHPDKLAASASAEQRAASEELFKSIASAWEILGDVARRADLDAGRRVGGFGVSAAPARSSRDVFREFFGSGWGDDEREAPGDASSMAAGGAVRISTRYPEDVLNLPLFEGYLVLDPRPAAERATSRVVTSVGCEPADIAARGWLAWFRSAADEFSHDRYSPVLVLDDVSEARALAASLAAFLGASAESARGGAELEAAAGAEGYPVRALRALRASCRSIWLVSGGSAAAIGSFPVLSAAWPGSRPTPHFIAPGVLLGSRAVPWESAYLAGGLGVTHAIVAKASDAGGEALPGIARLVLDVADDEDAAADMGTAWTAAVAFIDAARAAGPARVLIRVHGRSRSASFALAWLCASHGLPVAVAAQLLRARVPAIDWSLAFPQAVLAWLAAAPPRIEGPCGGAGAERASAMSTDA